MLSKVQAYLHVDYKPGERRLVQKIDFFILTFCCLSYFVNYVSPVCLTLTRIMILICWCSLIEIKPDLYLFYCRVCCCLSPNLTY
jgi:hypothetical protein